MLHRLVYSEGRYSTTLGIIILAVFVNSVFLFEIGSGSGIDIEFLGLWIVQVSVSMIFPTYIGFITFKRKIKITHVSPGLIIFAIPPSQLARNLVIFTGYVYQESLIYSLTLFLIVTSLLFVFGYGLGSAKEKLSE